MMKSARWVGIAHDSGLPAYAVVFDTPAQVCEQRNAQRARPIPRGAPRNQITRSRQVFATLDSEDFDAVHTHQPVAAVPPSIAVAAAATPEDRRGSGHTFGLLISRFDWDGASVASTMTSIAQRAEAAGFRHLWVMDHFRQIQRVGTLDVLSGGRAICGLGLAWDESEHAAYGIEFPDRSWRYRRLEDTLRMLPLLWGKGAPRFEGTTFSAEELICYPRPIQGPIPILVGGSGERRTLGLVARYADACNVFGDPGRVRHKVEVLRSHCEKEGRDPTEIEVTHLTNALVADDRASLRGKVEALRGRNTSVEDYARARNAGTVDDLVGLFRGYSEAGADHTIVTMPDVAREGSLETFADVIAAMASP